MASPGASVRNDRRLEHGPKHVLAANVESFAKCGICEHEMAVPGSPHDEILLRIEKLAIVRRAIRKFPMRVFELFELVNFNASAPAQALRNPGKPSAPMLSANESDARAALVQERPPQRNASEIFFETTEPAPIMRASRHSSFDLL